MTVYVYGSSVAEYNAGKPLTIATLGVLKPDTPLTVGTQGILVPLYVSPPVVTDIVLGGSAIVSTTDAYSATGTIIISGEVPITIAIGGQHSYNYKPSAASQVSLAGSALLVADVGGNLRVLYPASGGESVRGSSITNISLGHASTGGIVTGGTAPTLYTPAGSYISTGGIVTGGTALVTFTPIEEERGGKGTPMFRRTKSAQRNVYYYTAEALRERKYQDTDFGLVLKGRGSVALTGTADLLFIPAKFQFIKSLPRLPKPELIPDSEFKQLYQELLRRHPTKSYDYVATGGVGITGKCDEEYFDFANFLIAHDDELIIADILSTDGNPFLVTKYDLNLQTRRREDDELIEILEIF